MSITARTPQKEGAAGPRNPSLSRETVDVHGASMITGLSVSFLNKARVYRDDGPPYYRCGRRCLYPINGLREWMTAHTVGDRR